MNAIVEPGLFAYRGATTLLGPLAPIFLAWRQKRGKEDPDRLNERRGWPGVERPEGHLAWLHGASVGEALALLPLAERLIDRGLRVLVTTGTVASANILSERLPPGALHQYIPIDVPVFARRFLDHWRPELVVFAESEIWPNLICEASLRSIPLVLVNARVSRRSYRRWRAAGRMIGLLLARIDLVLAQTRDDGLRLARLGAPRVQVVGNLKYDVPPPPIDRIQLAELVASIGPRPLWLAASTHPEEEVAILDAHQQLAEAKPSVLTIVAPRHSARGPEIAALAAVRGIQPAQRSRREPITRDTGLYIADTMGELGLFYRLANLVFMGKSIGRAEGGQNPIEPAKLGAAVLHGPNVDNFREVYEAMATTRGAALVADAPTLGRVLAFLLSDPAQVRSLARGASEAVEKLGGATNAVMVALEPFLLQMRLAQR